MCLSAAGKRARLTPKRTVAPKPTAPKPTAKRTVASKPTTGAASARDSAANDTSSAIEGSTSTPTSEPRQKTRITFPQMTSDRKVPFQISSDCLCRGPPRETSAAACKTVGVVSCSQLPSHIAEQQRSCASFGPPNLGTTLAWAPLSHALRFRSQASRLPPPAAAHRQSPQRPRPPLAPLLHVLWLWTLFLPLHLLLAPPASRALYWHPFLLSVSTTAGGLQLQVYAGNLCDGMLDSGAAATVFHTFCRLTPDSWRHVSDTCVCVAGEVAAPDSSTGSSAAAAAAAAAGAEAATDAPTGAATAAADAAAAPAPQAAGRAAGTTVLAAGSVAAAACLALVL